MKSITGKLLALFLALTLAAGLAPMRVSAAGEVSSFPDVTDPAVGEAVEILRTMGIVNGADDGKYHPERSLTRAEFCKMTVLAMGEGSSVGAYETRTIFPDVTAACWARGYINYASQRNIGTGEEDRRLVNGKPDGLFWPDEAVTFDQAFTILLRVLGYGAEADTNWPRGAEAQAIRLGLTADLGAFAGSADLDRGSAAVLFRNMLMTAPSGGKTAYIESRATLTKNMIYFSSEVTAEGLHFLSVEDSGVKDVYVKPGDVIPGEFLVGRRGTAAIDTVNETLLAFIPESGSALRTVTVKSVTSKAITTRGGDVIDVPAAATVLPEKENGSSFLHRYRELDFPGMVLTLIYSTTGTVEYILISEAENVTGLPYVAESDGSGAFDAVTGGRRDCRIIKNDSEIPYSAVVKYDVGIYDEKANTVYVSDFRLTAMYEQAENSNVYVPSKIKLLGTEFDVSEAAIPDFEEIMPGDIITALFAPDGKIAGIKSESEVGGNTIGRVTDVTKETDSYEGNELGEDGEPKQVYFERTIATVEIINFPYSENGSKKISIETELKTAANATTFSNKIVKVTGSSKKDLKTKEKIPVATLLTVKGDVSGAFDVSELTIGGIALTENARIFESIENSDLTEVSISDISIGVVPADKVTFARLNSDKKVDMVILEDVTGDLYTYGIISYDTKVTQDSEFGKIRNRVTTISCVNDKDSDKNLSVVGTYGTEGAFGGIVKSNVMLGYYHRCASYVSLTKIGRVTRTDFDVRAKTFSRGNATMPVAEAVRLYDQSSGLWIENVDWTDFILYNKSLSVYYDRTPETGGKVRIIVAE